MKYFFITFSALFLFMTVSAHAIAAEKALFAGGCFWCMQPSFDKTGGVLDTVVGFSGGKFKNPTYNDVTSGGTGHVESIEITYDPTKVTYERLLDIYWENIDPFDAEGQFADKGEHYKTVIFYSNDDQKRAAKQSIAALQAQFPDTKIHTDIRPASAFYAAEEYHQDYYKKNTLRYEMYKYGSGRVKRLQELWGDTDNE